MNKEWVEKFNEEQKRKQATPTWTYTKGNLTITTKTYKELRMLENVDPPRQVTERIEEQGLKPLYKQLVNYTVKNNIVPDRQVTVHISTIGYKESPSRSVIPLPPDEPYKELQQRMDPENYWLNYSLRELGWTPSLKRKYLDLVKRHPLPGWVAFVFFHEFGHMIKEAGEIQANAWAYPHVEEFLLWWGEKYER